MKEKIPPARVILYSILGCLTIVLCSLFWMVSTINRTKNAREELLLLGEKIQLKASEQETNRRIMAQYQGKDALFLHKKLESLPLLSSEIELLKTKVAISALPEDIVLEKRLQQLTSGDNSFSFVETSTDVGKHYKEVVEHQTRPVEVDTNDLFKILSLLEGPQGEEESRPHCIISEARLDRKKTVVHEEWTLSLNIVRREYML
jgi:hypothetical protein